MNVLITGCSRGIGKELLTQLINRSDVDKIFALSSNVDLIPNDTKVVPINVDFLKDSWFNEVQSIIGDLAIGILINNAGYLFNGSIGESSQEEIDKTFKINYNAPLILVEGLLSNLKKGKAHIINIGSMGGYFGSAKFPGLSIYSSSKAALANLSECWAEELKDFGVKSNCLALGAVNTEMLKEAFPGYEAPVTAQEMAQSIINFAFNFGSVMNGKIVPFSVSTP